MNLMKKYRILYEQAFVPIFVKDDYCTETLLKGCELAGFKALEYTLRREDAKQVIPTLRGRYPHHAIIVGSTLDSDTMVKHMAKRFPQLMTIDEIHNHQVDGFVSMLGWSLSKIRQYCGTHLVMVTASTTTEALLQADAGAQFIKFDGGRLDFVKACRAQATFDFCPVFVTGGMTVERIPEAVEAGAVLVGSGFDLTLKGIQPGELTPEMVCERLLSHQKAVLDARARVFPSLAGLAGLTDREFFDRLPHYHPFGDLA